VARGAGDSAVGGKAGLEKQVLTQCGRSRVLGDTIGRVRGQAAKRRMAVDRGQLIRCVQLRIILRRRVGRARRNTQGNCNRQEAMRDANRVFTCSYLMLATRKLKICGTFLVSHANRNLHRP
jgi:hypothetical protein